MNPIPTTNAMNPAPGKGITSFPTPVLNDVIVAEVVNAWKGDYQALEYGTKWDDVPHGSQQISRPDHKLVFQTTISEDGQWVRRIWANDRVDQDTYNYAIKYSGGSPDHPIYIRTYVEPRDTYTPLPENTPDPVYPSALLVDEEVVRQQNELDSEYVQVVRVYETIPGPAITSKRVNDRGDTETIVTQIVPPGTTPDPDGLLVTGTQVQQESTSKGVKTTSTVESHSQLETKDRKDGLLGETTTTEDIVDPSTTPETLSTSVIASTVQQISATKAVKRTTNLTGPSSLSRKSKDGKLLGDTTTTQSVVTPNSSPDEVSNSVLASEVNQVDSGKAIKTNVVLNSTPTLEGEQKEPGLLGKKTTTESVVPAGTQADALTETILSSIVEPIDSVRSRKQTVESTGPASLVGSRINERGDIETIEESIVGAGTNPDPDELLQTSSSVEPIDEAKSKKTTSTVASYSQLETKDKKDGLLGETTTTEDIVDPTETPDELSTSVIASTVQQISATKAVKRTTTASGPTSLEQKSKDGKLIGDITITESIVTPNTSPDAPSGTNTGILSSEIRQTDSGKAIKRNTVLNSTPILLGSDTKGGLLGETSVEESVVASGTAADAPTTSIISSTVEPIDSSRSRKVTVTSIGPTSLSGKDKKEGLLGETTVTESIVPAGTEADPLSQTVISSSIQPIDSAKSKKTTITASGPTSLTQKIDDGTLFGGIEKKQTISPPNEEPDLISGNLISSEVIQIDSGKSIKTNTKLVNESRKFSGSRNSSGLLGETTVEETIVDANESADPLDEEVISSTVEQVTNSKSKKTTIKSSGPKSFSGGRLSARGDFENIEEEIVDAQTEPDEDDLNIISSSVEQIDSQRAKKTTVRTDQYAKLESKRSGSINIPSEFQNLVELKITSSIVKPSEQLTQIGGGTLESSIKSITASRAEKVDVELSTPGEGEQVISETLINDRLQKVTINKTLSLGPQTIKPSATISGSVQDLGNGLTIKTEQNIDDIFNPDEIQTVLNFPPRKFVIEETSQSNISTQKQDLSPPGTVISRSSVKNTEFTFQNSASSANIIESYTTKQRIDGDYGGVDADVTESIRNIKRPDKFNEISYSEEASSGYKIKKLVSIKDSYPEMTGVDYDQRTGIPIRFSKQVVKQEEAENDLDYIFGKSPEPISYKPIDKSKGVRIKYKPGETLGDLYFRTETTANVKLPDQLIEVKIYWGKGEGEGEEKSDAPTVTGESYSYSKSSGYTSSESISGDVFFKIRNGYNGPVKAYRHVYFKKYDPKALNINPIKDINNFLGRLGLRRGKGVEEWPKYTTETNNIVINYGSSQVRNDTSISESASINGASQSTSKGTSYSINQLSKSVQIPNALCEGVDIDGGSEGVDGELKYGTTYSVNPTNIEATNPSKFEKGEYLIESNVDFFRDGYLKIEAISAVIEGEILPF